jgi:preprotein translocase YajC subunit
MQAGEISFVIMVGVIAAFYIIFIRPASKEQMRVKDIIRDLHVGDEIITTAGFFARIKQIETPEDGPVQLVLDFGHGVEMRALTTSILRRLTVAPEPIEQAEQVKGT